MKDLKDWTAEITGLAELGVDDTIQLYSDMLATAHDLGYKVPDAELVETEDAEKLKKVIPPLHTGLVAFHADAVAQAKEKEAKQTKKAAKPIKKVKKDAPTKPVKPTAQKAASKETNTMAKTAKKAKAPAKKAAKAAPAAKASKKAAASNARTPVIRNPFGDKAVIKVLVKENPAKADSQRGKRIAVVMKYNGKKVADYYAKEKAPFNRTDTLRFMIDNDYITIK